jgi:hypothetical protein
MGIADVRPLSAGRRATMKLPLLALGIICLGGAASCGSEPATNAGPSDVTVELDAYSGLPNPVWTLSAVDSRELADRLRRLPEQSRSAPPVQSLGYRGFRVRNPGGDGGIPEQVDISGGLIVEVVDDRRRGRTLRDDAGIERWLIEMARQKGYEEVFP